MSSFCKKCRKAKGIDDGRAMHTLRKRTIWYWREVLRLDIETISELAGHRIDVNVRHYQRKWTPEEMARAVSSVATPADVPTKKPTKKKQVLKQESIGLPF